MHTVTVEADRPDFRVFIDLLYGPERNVDTEGNSVPVNSRTWTWLHIADRATDDPYVEIAARENDPSQFDVSSESSALEQLAALYLYLYCGASIAEGSNIFTAREVEELRSVHADALLRATNSMWHKSSDATPYPNFA